MYQCLLQLGRLGIYSSPWLTCMKKICNECGFSGIWLLQDVHNPIWIKKAIEQRLKDQWIVLWQQNLSTKSICSNYKLFKHEFGMEKYLTKLKKCERILITKFRTCNNRLPINTGRYQGIDREDRICNKCNDGVGDEFHLLFECTDEEISRLRVMYLPVFYTSRPTHHKYISLMSNSSQNILKKLYLFLKYVMNRFR